MAEVVGIQIQVGGNAGEAVGSLRKQLKEAQAEVAALSDKFGATSAQAVQAAKRAAELKDRIGDAKALTDAFNPDRKFQAFATALQGVAGGFSAVQGALGLIGVESDEVQKTLLKVQSAMALSQGINSVLEARDSFKNLSTVIQSTTIFQKANNAATIAATAVQRALGIATVQTSTAFKVLKGVIASAGIGLLIVGVTTLISKISQWTSSTDNNKAAQERLNRALEEQERLFARQQEDLGRQRELANLRAKTAGQGADEIFKINQDFNKKDRDAAVQNFNTILSNVKKFEKDKLQITKDGKLKGSEEDVKAYNDAKKQLEAANKQIRDIDFKNQTDILNNQIRINDEKKKNTDSSNQKATQAAEQLKQKQEQDRQERLQAEQDAGNRILEIQDEIFLQSIKDETQRALVKLSQDKERQINEINAGKQTAELKAKEIALIEEKFRQDKNKIEDDAAKERKEKEQKELEERQERDKKNQEERAARLKQQYEYEKGLREEFQQAELEAEKFLRDQKIALLDAGINLATAIAGRNEKLANAIFAVQKAIEIGRIITSTTASIAKLKADTFSIPAFVGPGIPNPLFVKALAVMGTKIAGLKIGAATSIASIAAASISKFKSGSGGGNIGGTQDTGSAGGGGAAPITPPSPQAALTQLDQATINRLGSATNRAYVVESDITNSQERITRINRAARLN